MLIRAVILAVSMVAATGLSIAFTPKPLYSLDHRPEVSLDQLFPKQFGIWRLEPGGSQIVSPDVQASLARYYTDTLSRTYLNDRGDRIMLSLAYGADQGRAMQVHKPEVCYEGQGYKILNPKKDETQVAEGAIPVMRLVAKQGARNEPITYWIRSGDDVIRGWLEQNTARVKAGFRGHLPDGILIRVSTIDSDPARAYQTHDVFVRDMLASLTPPARKMILGDHFLASR